MFPGYLQYFLTISLLFLTYHSGTALLEFNVVKTEIFTIPLHGKLFNWTSSVGNTTPQIVYKASLKDHPDLPSWIKYVYSTRRHTGYLYGVPPSDLNPSKGIDLDLVALNRRTYESKIEALKIFVGEKLHPARYEILLKIDNLNVVDVFDGVEQYLDRLRAILQRDLMWSSTSKPGTTNSDGSDLHVTFLESALRLGARKPLDPKDGDGVVLRLGSQTPFSTVLIDLQEEVRPLWKMPSCPRDFKRTSVERFFRNAGFSVDWCTFRLIDGSNAALHHQSIKVNSALSKHDPRGNKWFGVDIEDLPIRSYSKEAIFTVTIPLLILTVLLGILSAILCIRHDDFDKQSEKLPVKSQGTVHLMQNGIIATKPDANLLNGYCGSTNSPNASINRSVHCRPSPPPYIKPKIVTEF